MANGKSNHFMYHFSCNGFLPFWFVVVSAQFMHMYKIDTIAMTIQNVVDHCILFSNSIFISSFVKLLFGHFHSKCN